MFLAGSLAVLLAVFVAGFVAVLLTVFVTVPLAVFVAMFLAVFLAVFLVSPVLPHPSRIQIPLSPILSEKAVDSRLSAICPERALTQHSVSPPRRHNLVHPP